MSQSRTKEPAKEAVASTSAGGPANARAATAQTAEDWWYQLDQRVHTLIKMWLEGDWWQQRHHAMIEAVGEIVARHQQAVSKTTDKLNERVARVEVAGNFEERFHQLVGEAKRGSEIPAKRVVGQNRQLAVST